MEWAGCRERFGNTPENESRPDLSKLNPGGSRFQTMVLKHHLTAKAVISEAGTASKFGKQLFQVWDGPRSGPKIAQQSEKAGRQQMKLASI